MSKFVKSNGKWVITLCLVSAMILGGFGTVSAAEFPKGETIPASQTIDDDVFISGNNVVVDGTVNGILIAAGQTITVNGTVVGDAILMGETIVVSKDALIDGNLFSGAAEIIVEGTVTGSVFGGSSAMTFGSTASAERNLFYGGFSLETEQGSTVGKDLYSGVYQAMLSGDVGRDANIGAAALQLAGAIGRNAIIDLGKVDDSAEATAWMDFNPYISRYVDTMLQPGLTIAETASIAGDVRYTSSVDETSELAAVAAGGVVYQTPAPYENEYAQQDKYSGQVKTFRRSTPGGFVWSKALSVTRTFIKLFVLGALALWLLAKPFKKLVDAAYQQPLKSMGWGFILMAIGFLAMFILPLVFVMVGVLVGFLSLTSLLYVWFGLIGTALLLAVMLFWFAVFTLSKLLAAYMFGAWLMKAVFKQTEEKVWLNLLVGVFMYVVIAAIPVIGWLASLAASLIGTGAFWLAFTQKKA